MIRPIAVWSARVIISALFLTAGVIKAGASEQFAVGIAQFSLLPDGFVDGFALSLPFVEMIAGILLLIPRTVIVGAVMVTALLGIFISAILWAFSQGIVVDCSCFGPGFASETLMALTILRNVVLLAMTWGLAVHSPNPDPRHEPAR